MTPLKHKIYLDKIPAQGRFGAIRKHDIHTGVDLHCPEFALVYAMETGTVVNICPFTGDDAGSPWWNDTSAVLIKGRSGIVLYGEVGLIKVKVGDRVTKGDNFACVFKVLKNDKGLPTSMLHVELYHKDYIGDGEWWKHDEPQPRHLKNVEAMLKRVDERNDPYLQMKKRGLTDAEIADGTVFDASYYMEPLEAERSGKEIMEEFRKHRQKMKNEIEAGN